MRVIAPVELALVIDSRQLYILRVTYLVLDTNHMECLIIGHDFVTLFECIVASVVVQDGDFSAQRSLHEPALLLDEDGEVFGGEEDGEISFPLT